MFVSRAVDRSLSGGAGRIGAGPSIRAFCGGRVAGGDFLGALTSSGEQPSGPGGEVQPIWMEARISSRAARSCGEVSGKENALITTRVYPQLVVLIGALRPPVRLGASGAAH